MVRTSAAKGPRRSRSSRKPQRSDRTRAVKGVILLVAASLSLAAGIYKGEEGLFFGVVFAMACGLVGVLYLVRDTNKIKARTR